jgi:hypothetical protein
MNAAAGTAPQVNSFTTSTFSVDSSTQSTAISSTYIQIIIIGGGALLTGIAMLLISFLAFPGKTSKIIVKFDTFFADAHSTTSGTSPINLPTKLGGILTMGVIIAFVTAGTVAIFNFVSPDNSIYSQTLSLIPVQLPTNTSSYQFTSSFLAPDSICNGTADVDGFQGGSQRLTFAPDAKDKQTCVITWSCDSGCTLVGLLQRVRLSMVSAGVGVAMMTYSVIYPYYSLTSYGINGGPVYPPYGVFRGNDTVTKVYITSIPTQLYMLGNKIIPSLSDTQQTLGIKLQYMSFQMGTTVDETTFVQKGDVVSFEFEIDMSTTTLIVQEVQRQSLLNMVGSFAGLLGTILAVFKSVFPFTEKIIYKVKQLVDKRRIRDVKVSYSESKELNSVTSLSNSASPTIEDDVQLIDEDDEGQAM